jgi:hypothetical protein
MNCHICEKKYTQINKYLKCNACGHIYIDPKRDTVEYHRNIYRKKSGRKRGTKAEFNKDGSVNSVFHEVRKKITEGRMEIAKKLYLPTSTALDIGAGGGTFAQALQERIQLVECLEVEPNLIAECRRLGFTTFEKDFLSQEFNKQYDIVFCWHVLEHIPDVKLSMKKMVELAYNFVVFEVPTKRGTPKVYRGHCHHFCEESIQVLLDQYPITYKFVDAIQKPATAVICTI